MQTKKWEFWNEYFTSYLPQIRIKNKGGMNNVKHNTIIGMMGKIAVIGLFGCLWKFLGIKLQKMKKQKLN